MGMLFVCCCLIARTGGGRPTFFPSSRAPCARAGGAPAKSQTWWGGKVRLSLVGVEESKGIWWMPWRQEAMKDVARCDKPRGAASRL